MIHINTKYSDRHNVIGKDEVIHSFLPLHASTLSHGLAIYSVQSVQK